MEPVGMRPAHRRLLWTGWTSQVIYSVSLSNRREIFLGHREIGGRRETRGADWSMLRRGDLDLATRLC